MIEEVDDINEELDEALDKDFDSPDELLTAISLVFENHGMTVPNLSEDLNDGEAVYHLHTDLNIPLFLNIMIDHLEDDNKYEGFACILDEEELEALETLES
jgi:hypothetical protein